MSNGIRLHMLGLPHTITRNEFSHCAFTGKVLRFAPMMRSRGFEVFHYGVETSESGADRDINVFSKDEWLALRIDSYKFLHPALSHDQVVEKLNDHTQFVGDLGNMTTPLYQEFNRRLTDLLKENYRNFSTDIVCLPFGPAHEIAIGSLNCVAVETGIGYNNAYKNYRIYESYAQMHTDVERNSPPNYWFVCPNYYNVLEFPMSLSPRPNTVGFFGRIGEMKGCGVIVEIAKRMPHVQFILCGQGDVTPYLGQPNIQYKAPISGSERGEYLGSLTALIAPTRFAEPFCGVSVEAQLCGTPVISHDHGALCETVEMFKTGVRAHTLADFCYGIQMAIDGKFDRNYIRERAVRLYDMYNVAKQYDYTFRSILDIHNGKNGWYSPDTHIGNLLI